MPVNSPWKDFTPGRIVGIVIGFIIGSYAGIHALVPALAMLILGFIVKKTTQPDFADYVVLFAIQAGQLLVMIGGGLYMGKFGQVLPDAVLLIPGLIWLIIRPGKLPLWYLSAFQLMAVVVGILGLFSNPYGSLEQRALTAHVAFRVIAIFLMMNKIFKKNTESIHISDPTRL